MRPFDVRQKEKRRNTKMMTVGIIGCGFVGGALKAWLEENNKNVKVVVSDPPKGMNDDISGADVYFLQIHVPTEDDGTQDLTLMKEIIRGLPDRPVFVRTTILPGSSATLTRETGHRVYFMPEFLFALFMFLAFNSVKDYPGNKKRIRTSLICFGILSLLRYSAMLFYSVTYEFISSPYDGRLSSPVKFWIVYAIIAVLTAASCAFMIVLSVEHHRFRNHMIVESVGKANNESVYRDEMDEARRKELRHKSIAVLVLQIIYAVATVATTMMIPFGEVSDAFGLQWLYRMLLLAAAMIGIYAVSLSISSEAARIK